MKFHAALAVAMLAAACTPAEAPVEHWKRCDESAALAANGEPAGLTFFAPSHEEERLIGLAAACEAATKQRQAPMQP
jgi:hypothetical protein